MLILSIDLLERTHRSSLRFAIGGGGGNKSCFLPLVDFEFLSVLSVRIPSVLEFAPLKADVLTCYYGKVVET